MSRTVVASVTSTDATGDYASSASPGKFTRAEETYKMLGYLENFRGLFDPLPFSAALCFITPHDLFTEIATERGDKIVLVGAHPDDPGICAMGGRMDTLIAEWLAQAVR
ncbi:MAG TPA: hypothetical protein VGM98_00390 [Schlesneria sp.]|jgi:hypothetical protein